MDLLTASERQRLDEDGFLTLRNIVRPSRLTAMRKRLEALLAVTKQEHLGTLVVPGLLEEELFDAAWLHSRVLDAVGQVLGEGFRLMGVALRGPGASAQL